MASKTVNEILQTERQADLAVEQARAQAKALLLQAQEEGGQLLADQTRLARQEADALRREAGEKADEILRKAQEEAGKQAEALRDSVRAKREDAFMMVIRCMIPQYPIEGRRSDGKM